MNEIIETRVCSWCFDMQLRADQKEASECFRNIVQDASITKKIHLDVVSFAWSLNANRHLVDVFGFIHAHKNIRTGTIRRWLQDDRILNQVNWNPCAGDKGQDWTNHSGITEYLSKSSSEDKIR